MHLYQCEVFDCVYPQQGEFGDFQGQTGYNNNLQQAWNQSDFGDFQSKGSVTAEVNQNSSQSNKDDFGSFQTGSSVTSLGLNDPSMIATKSQEEDFGDFLSGKESGIFNAAPTQESKQQDQLQKNVHKFGNFQVGEKLDSKVKACEPIDINLLSKAAESNSTKSIINNDNNSLAETDYFGDFQHSPGPFSSDNAVSFNCSSSEKLASSLEKFKLASHTLPSTQGGVKSPSLPGYKDLGKGLTDRKEQADNNKQKSKGNLSKFADFPVLGDDPSQTASSAKTSEDRYSALRDADFSSGDGLFNVQQPALGVANPDDDEFADFAGFEVADQFTSEDDFGAFKSTDDLQGQSFGVFGNSQPAQQPTTASSTASVENYNQDFGSFNSFGNTHLSKPLPEKDHDGGFGAFGSFVTGPSSASSSRPHSTTTSDSLINSVSLEPTERYKVLSHDSGVGCLVSVFLLEAADWLGMLYT